MRLTSFGIVLVIVTSFFVNRTGAQIPERVLFQPGSYTYNSYHTGNRGVPQYAVPQAAPLGFEEESVAEEAITKTDDDSDKTEWEVTFGTGGEEDSIEFEAEWGEAVVPVQSNGKTVPYLAYHRNPWTHRIHVVPYEPGYAEEPETFPEHQSKLNLLLSTLPCREQNRPQVKYASYYDPDPVIIEDKPSRLQLILGYPNGAWTSCCDNRWGHRLAQCPGVEPIPMGPYAEIGVKDQPVLPVQPGPLGGLFAGPRPMDYVAQPRRGFRGLRSALSPAPYPYQVAEQNSSYPITQQLTPYPPYTAQSISRSHFAKPCLDCITNQNDKTVPVCTCHSIEKDCDSCKHCKSCQSCNKSCESTDCNRCGTAKTIHCPIKKAMVKKAATVSCDKKTPCNTKTEEKSKDEKN